MQAAGDASDWATTSASVSAVSPVGNRRHCKLISPDLSSSTFLRSAAFVQLIRFFGISCKLRIALTAFLLVYILGIGQLLALTGRPKENQARFVSLRLAYNAGARRGFAQPAGSSLRQGPITSATPHNTVRTVPHVRQQVGVSTSNEAEPNARLPFPPLALPSDAWQPWIINTCMQGMPDHFAPCLATRHDVTNLQVAEEVVYPDFAIRSPWYVLSEHAEVIERHLHVRFRKERRHGKGPNWFYYLNQHGRNFVFINTTYHPGQLPIAWTPNGGHCMGGKPAEPLKIVQPNTRFGNGDVHASLMFAASPDSYSFQHWSDRVAMMLVQTERHRSNTTKYIAMPPRDDAVAMGWQLLGNVGDPSRQILSPAMPLQAQSLIFACDTPLVHPYLMLRFAESLKAAAGLDPKGRPLQDRKVVVLATRMNDKNTFNGGRRWLNYKECMAPIQKLLKGRNQGEKLEEWDLSRFGTHVELVDYWSNEVRAVIGVHGGALYNVQYATTPTMVIEIWPVSQDKQRVAVPTPNVIWEICSTRGLQHWALPVPIANGSSSDVNVDCSMLVNTLAQHLGTSYGSVVEPFYQGTMWSA